MFWQGNDHVCSSALSPCGSWLAYSTLSGVRLYRLQYNNISITKVSTRTLCDCCCWFFMSLHGLTIMPSVSLLLQVSKLPKELNSARHLCFSSDSSKLFASSSHSSVVVASLGKLECKYVHTLKPVSGECEHES